MNSPKKILVTGAAGFIGFHLSKRLLDLNYEVMGIDNLNDYYDVSLKRDRLRILESHSGFSFKKLNIEDRDSISNIFTDFKPSLVGHLAAQAGVRYSITNPEAYIKSNLNGFFSVIDASRQNGVEHFVYASTSSVYGSNESMPFSEHHGANHPLTLYAATKKSNELIAHSYSNIFSIPTTGLRFFTVYGPWGRPDMAMFIFTRAILSGEPLQVFNYGDMKRDFTFVEDIVSGIINALLINAGPDLTWDPYDPNPGSSKIPYRIYNIGNHKPVSLKYVIELLGKYLDKKPVLNLMPMQQGDIKETFADISQINKNLGYVPTVSIEDGVKQFVDWYMTYFYRDR